MCCHVMSETCVAERRTLTLRQLGHFLIMYLCSWRRGSFEPPWMLAYPAHNSKGGNRDCAGSDHGFFLKISGWVM